MTQYREIRTAADAESIRDVIESVYDGWFAEGRIDWEDFIDRAEQDGDLDLGMDTQSPAIQAIKRIVKQLRKESE